MCCVQPTKPVHLKGLHVYEAFDCKKTLTSKTNWTTETCFNLIHLIPICPAYFYSKPARVSKIFGCVLASPLLAHAPVSSKASSVAFCKHAYCCFPQARAECDPGMPQPSQGAPTARRRGNSAGKQRNKRRERSQQCWRLIYTKDHYALWWTCHHETKARSPGTKFKQYRKQSALWHTTTSQ